MAITEALTEREQQALEHTQLRGFGSSARHVWTMLAELQNQAWKLRERE